MARTHRESAEENAVIASRLLTVSKDDPADKVQARAAVAQATASLAAAQALLDIGNLLREHLTRGDA